MPYRSVQIPFANGQDEGFDQKLLPDGKFRSVKNMKIERDGRYARRLKLLSKTELDPTGSTVSVETVGFAEPNGFVSRTTNTSVRAHKWASGSPEVLRELPGRLPHFFETEKFYAAQRSFETDNTLFLGHEEANWKSQVMPQIDLDYNNNIITAYIQGKNVWVSLRNPETMDIINSTKLEVDSGDATIISLRVIASKVSSKIAIATYYRNADLPLAELIVYTFDTADGFAPINDNTTSRLAGGGSVGFASAFDIFARPDRDTFLIAYQDGDTGDAKLDEYEFDQDMTAAPLDEIDSIALGTLTPLDYPLCFSVVCGNANERWCWGVSGSGSIDPRVRAAFFGGVEAVVFTGIEFSDSAPLFCFLSTDEVAIVTSAFDGETGRPRIQVRLWDISTDTATTKGTFDWSQGSDDPPVALSRGFNLELAIGYPVKFGSGGTAILKIPLAYSVGDDTFVPTADDPKVSQTNAYLASMDMSSGQVTIDSVIHSAGVEYREWEGGTNWAAGFYIDTAMPRPIIYERLSGETSVIYPVMLDAGRAEVNMGESEVPINSVSWVRLTTGSTFGKQLRDNETLYPGGVLHFSDSDRVSLAGFMAPPTIDVNATEVPGLTTGINQQQEFFLTAVLEYVDANGRLWRSAPADIKLIAMPSLGNTANRFSLSFTILAPIGLTGQELGAQVAVYASNYGDAGSPGATLYRRFVVEIGPGKRYHYAAAGINPYVGNMEDPPEGTPVLYTQSGELSNDPPPACTMIASTRTRVFAAGLPEKTWIQASKFLNETRGVEWSNLDSFKVIIPAPVTGLSAMDDSLVAFTRDKVFAIHGAGPDNTGIGAFSEPQLIPGSSGCINSRSVISTEMGVLYQSLRGIELIPRGFASSQWVGQPVRDTLEQFPTCRGVCQSPKDWTVRWLFSSALSSVVIVWDGRAKAWYIFDYFTSQAFHTIGVCVGKDNNFRHTAMFLANDDERFVEDVDGESEALAVDSGWIETGDMRFAAVQGWFSGRRVNLLGQFGGRACNVTLQFAFDGEDYLPQDTFTWALTEAEWGNNVPVSLELTLPVQLFSSARFKITVDSLDDTVSNDFTFKPSGMAVYYTPRAEGPRLPGRNTG